MRLKAAQSQPQPDTATNVLVQVSGLRKSFVVERGLLGRPRTSLRAVDGVDFRINAGQTLGLVGESGCGKSTTGRLILQLQRPSEGSVRLDGTELTTLPPAELRVMRRKMQMIFQDSLASLDPRVPVGKAISEAVRVAESESPQPVAQQVKRLMDDVGLASSLADHYPHEISGGQRQRVGIARALAARPQFIVADEPVSALDVSIQAQIINLMRDLQIDRELTYLFIAHDLAIVRHVSDQVAVMYLGKIVEIGDRDELYDKPQHPYTIALLSAVPVPDPQIEVARERIILRGEVPSAVNPPTGCRFRTRCWKAEAVCAEQEPELVQRGGRHPVACFFPE